MIFPRPVVTIGRCMKIKGQIYKGARQLKFQDMMWSAHRLSYHLNVHPIPTRLKISNEGLICHTCDNSWCINPKHLYLGTSRQNVNDMYDRHPTIHEIRAKGMQGRKLSAEAKRKISLAKMGNQNRLGKGHSEETKRKLALAAKGNKHRLGKKHSDATKKKISETKKRRFGHASN